MDYDNNRRYTQKSNTGFWIIALLTIALCAYMIYSHFVKFSESGIFKVVETYSYGAPVDYRSMISSAIFDFVCGFLYILSLLVVIYSILRKDIKILSISFFATLILTLAVFIINEILFYI